MIWRYLPEGQGLPTVTREFGLEILAAAAKMDTAATALDHGIWRFQRRSR
jgi:hypothetical protein